jgi:hypothetical protein
VDVNDADAAPVVCTQRAGLRPPPPVDFFFFSGCGKAMNATRAMRPPTIVPIMTV